MRWATIAHYVHFRISPYTPHRLTERVNVCVHSLALRLIALARFVPFLSVMIEPYTLLLVLDYTVLTLRFFTLLYSLRLPQWLSYPTPITAFTHLAHFL